MDKDHAIDRLLRQAASSRGNNDAADDCLSAELLAAWTDGGLSDSERSAAEAHAADCARCLAVLAAIAETSPAPHVSPRASWFSIKWLIPAATAGVAVIAWVLVQQPTETPSAVPVPQQEMADAQAKPSEAAARPAREIPLTPQAANRSPAVDNLEKKEAPAAKAPLARQRSDESADKQTAPARAPAPAPASSPVAPAPVAAPPATAGVAAGTPPVVTEPRAQATRDERRLAEQVQLRDAPVVVVAPDPSVRWRVAGTAIERSIDGGRNWQGQTVEGAIGSLAGASPSTTVCWLVGRAGLVLLTVDGQTWRRIEFPVASVDLVAVAAQDARTATATATDGRTYRTVDAGRTWTLQENPADSF